MAYTLIGGTAVGTILILLFLPALYIAWFRIKPIAAEDFSSAPAVAEGPALHASPAE